MEKAEQTSPLYRMAEACAMALLGALVCALPTVVRASAAGAGALDALVAALAVMLCVLLPLALILPRAARGWRGVVGQHTPRRMVVGLGLWVLLCGAVFTVLGTFLKAKTHHRGLGGATFGVFAAASAVVLAALVARGVAIGSDLGERPVARWMVRGTVGALVIGSLAAIGLPFASTQEQTEVLARAAVFDLLLTAVVVSLLLTRRAPKMLAGAAKLIALPVALSVIVIGFLRVESAHATTAIRNGGGAVATILGALERWTDQDGDGMGSHFGGMDCDEGNPERRPGFDDAPGDGIDHDCDGVDGAPAVAEVQPAPAPEPAPARSAATVVASAPKPVKKPDIIVVTLDTVRADRTTVYGYDKKTTPNLAAFAKHGIVFEHAYAAGSDTQRALTPVLSGTTLSSTPHTNKEWPRLRESANMVAERMKSAGYRTAGVSSFTWVRKGRGFEQGFDVLDESPWQSRHPEREYTGDLAVDAAVKQYRELSARDEPMYLWVHLFDAHDDYVEHAGIDFGEGAGDMYDGEIAFIDENLKKLFDTVNAGGRTDRTVWIIHGSHGEAFGEHGQTGHGMQLYDESIHVPLIVATPWSRPGRYETDAVSILDVAPTVLDLAGAATEDTSGVSLRPVLDGKPFERAPVAAYANRRVAIVDWPLKLYVFRRKDKRDRLLLFDLTQDPGETKDISADDKDNLVRLDEIREKTDQSSGDG
jgi:arylsulfatase A-like enzyme